MLATRHNSALVFRRTYATAIYIVPRRWYVVRRITRATKCDAEVVGDVDKRYCRSCVAAKQGEIMLHQQGLIPNPGEDLLRFWYAPRLQRCICRTVMWTIAPRTNFACRYRHACVYCLHECLVCATMSFRPMAPPGASGRAHTHALHVHIIANTFYTRAWSLRAAGLALHQPFWLKVW